MQYIGRMKSVADLHDKIDESDAPAERGYAAWKLGKIERGLAQAKDRGAMIPVEQIVADFKL